MAKLKKKMHHNQVGSELEKTDLKLVKSDCFEFQVALTSVGSASQ